jgi:opacity protein-like surface antigen
MKSLLIGTAMVALLASPSFAQSTNPQNQASSQANPNSSQNLVAAQKIKQDLQGAGFTDIKVVAESFVVQAKSKDGDPVLMTIGPHGMSVFEAMNSNNNPSNSTTGSSTGKSVNSGSQNK